MVCPPESALDLAAIWPAAGDDPRCRSLGIGARGAGCAGTFSRWSLGALSDFLDRLRNRIGVGVVCRSTPIGGPAMTASRQTRRAALLALSVCLPLPVAY